MPLAEAMCAPIITGAPGAFPYSFGILGSGWGGLTMIALLASLLILAAAYIFANFLRNQQLLAWTKFELFQIVATAVLFAATATLVFGMCTFKLDFLDTPGQPPHYAGRNMFEVAEAYFTGLEATGAILFGYLMHFAKIINLLQRITYISNPVGLGMEDNPLDSIGQLNSLVFFMVSGFITSYLLLGLQMKMLDYFGYAVLYYLFPFGIFFRAFEPTRAFGGTLLGLSLTFLLFYPLTIVFSDYIISGQLYDSNVGVIGPIENPGATGGDGSLMKRMHELSDPTTLQQAQEALSPERLKNDIGQPPTDPTGGLSPKNPGELVDIKNVQKLVGGISSGAIFIIKPLILYFVAAVALPVIGFIVLVEIARSLTKLLGEEIDVSNLTRLI